MTEHGNFKGVHHAELYLKYRPLYPANLYKTIFDYLPPEGRGSDGRYALAVDVGCGSGQSTRPLCDYFQKVIGVDTSEAQLAEARKASVGFHNITYEVSLAHDLSFVSDNSVDLITCAAAIHWFDLQKFFQECHRILKQDGVIAPYAYALPQNKDKAANEIFANFYRREGPLGDYWSFGVEECLNGYQTIYNDLSKAFDAVKRDDSMVIDMPDYTVENLLGFMKSSSVYQSYYRDHPDHPDILQKCYEQLQNLYGENASKTVIHCVFPVFLLLGKKK